MPSIEFFITSLIVVLLPGTGVIFTMSAGLTQGKRASLFAAAGCTLGIVPHLLASIAGLAALLHASSVAFQILKFAGVIYLGYLAWSMWRDSGTLDLSGKAVQRNDWKIALRAFLINILNPKLSIFFLAFLPQFVPQNSASPVAGLLTHSAVFMFLTLVVFIFYGLFANAVRHYLSNSPVIVRWVQRSFSGAFVAMGAKLALSER
ncbi:LysE family translocator [Aestuariirhabdus sp. Z084]|uniref:LysE family translocator n=1 Tax=Aestuariirhabdus haliotis TaxID=2918751 RepID=UPI00201B35DB|nr:LysE family translocator [Aestuariirhabdus haliotis]MCL6416913.1 LysE family translocator [Aestuariirhabdus haliotis]MCL6420925.1 LysE family translocator [Aestuariirhabdus haliotis]